LGPTRRWVFLFKILRTNDKRNQPTRSGRHI
jgi:hypothetical protein